MYKKIYLKRGKEESLKRFHPWVFSGAIAQMDEGIVDCTCHHFYRGFYSCGTLSDRFHRSSCPFFP